MCDNVGDGFQEFKPQVIQVRRNIPQLEIIVFNITKDRFEDILVGKPGGIVLRVKFLQRCKKLYNIFIFVVKRRINKVPELFNFRFGKRFKQAYQFCILQTELIFSKMNS